jgi:hypothetical protein
MCQYIYNHVTVNKDDNIKEFNVILFIWSNFNYMS